MSDIILPGEDGALYPRDRAWHPPANTPGYKSTTFRAPKHALLSLGGTASELTGPTFGHSSLNALDNDLIRNFSSDGSEAIGQRMIVYGQVLDENARAVPNTLVEFWQANAGGRYRHKREAYLAPLDPNFGGCGRAITDANGFYSFRTVKPGAYPWPNGGNDWRPAHIHFSVFGHVGAIPDKAAIDQLIARLDRHNTTPLDALAYRFDIVLRGRRSTMFENKLEGN